MSTKRADATPDVSQRDSVQNIQRRAIFPNEIAAMLTSLSLLRETPVSRLVFDLVATHIHQLMRDYGRATAHTCACGIDVPPTAICGGILLKHPGLERQLSKPARACCAGEHGDDNEWDTLLRFKFLAWVIRRTGDTWIHNTVMPNRHPMTYGLPPELVWMIASTVTAFTIARLEVPFEQLGLQSLLVMPEVPMVLSAVFNVEQCLQPDDLTAMQYLDICHIGRAVGLLSFSTFRAGGVNTPECEIPSYRADPLGLTAAQILERCQKLTDARVYNCFLQTKELNFLAPLTVDMRSEE